MPQISAPQYGSINPTPVPITIPIELEDVSFTLPMDGVESRYGERFKMDDDPYDQAIAFDLTLNCWRRLKNTIMGNEYGTIGDPIIPVAGSSGRIKWQDVLPEDLPNSLTRCLPVTKTKDIVAIGLLPGQIRQGIYVIWTPHVANEPFRYIVNIEQRQYNVKFDFSRKHWYLYEHNLYVVRTENKSGEMVWEKVSSNELHRYPPVFPNPASEETDTSGLNRVPPSVPEISDPLHQSGAELTPPIRYSLPIDDIMVNRLGHYMVKMKDGNYQRVVFDLESGDWRLAHFDEEYFDTSSIQIKERIIRTKNKVGKAVWVVRNKYINVQDILPNTQTREIFIPDVPEVPAGGTAIPKTIHYIWLGNSKLPDDLVSNIIANAHKSFSAEGNGYRSIIHVDVDNAEIFTQIRDALHQKAPGLEVQDLNQDDFFTQFKASKFGEMFAAARHGPNANFAAAADVLRYRLLHKYGGIYLDTDDPLIKSIIDRDFLAHPKDVLLGALLDGTKNTANMNYIYNTA